MKSTQIIAGLAIAGGLAAGAVGFGTGMANAAPGMTPAPTQIRLLPPLGPPTADPRVAPVRPVVTVLTVTVLTVTVLTVVAPAAQAPTIVVVAAQAPTVAAPAIGAPRRHQTGEGRRIQAGGTAVGSPTAAYA